MFVLAISRKIKETRSKFYQGGVTVLQMIANYQEVRLKLTNTQLNKLKSTAKNKTGTVSRINTKKLSKWRITIRITSINKTNNDNKKLLC